MEPTEAEAAAFATLDDVAQWAGLAHRPDGGADIDSPRGTLFTLLGVQAAAHPRVLGAITEPNLDTILATWQVSGAAPSPGVRSQGGLVGRACRIVCGAQQRIEVIRKQDADKLQLALLQASAGSGGGATAAGSVLGQSPNKKVKVATVADQANDLEVQEMSQADVQAAYARYQSITGGPPAAHEELTLDQLSALHALFSGSSAPYVDFSVWGPFGHRITKRVKMQGMSINSAGELQPVELFGPGTFDAWDACFRVWRTGCIMLGAISTSCLDAYRDLMALYNRRYGKDSWVILYQADVRARLEHIERVRRWGLQEHRSAQALGQAHPFDPAKPWEWSLRAVVDDNNYWRRELEEPAILVLARAAKMATMVDGDAPVANSHSAAAASVPAAPMASGGSSSRPKAGARTRPPKVHVVDSQGHFTQNRRGFKLCAAFQQNQCEAAGPYNKCPRDSSAVHQCGKCLSPGHGQASCPNAAGREPPPHRKGKGKGKAGGRRRDQY